MATARIKVDDEKEAGRLVVTHQQKAESKLQLATIEFFGPLVATNQKRNLE